MMQKWLVFSVSGHLVLFYSQKAYNERHTRLYFNFRPFISSNDGREQSSKLLIFYLCLSIKNDKKKQNLSLKLSWHLTEIQRNQKRYTSRLLLWINEVKTNIYLIWTNKIPLIAFNISKTEPIDGGCIWIGGSPVVNFPFE